MLKSYIEDENVDTTVSDFALTVLAQKKPLDRSDFRVLAHQQIYLDYRKSVVAKLLALRRLENYATSITGWFVWIDTDRAASDKLSLRLYWPREGRSVSVRFAPPRCEHAESRFIEMQSDRVQSAKRKLESLVRKSDWLPSEAGERCQYLCDSLSNGGSLSDFNMHISNTLIQSVINYSPIPILSSRVLTTSSLVPSAREVLRLILMRRTAFIDEWNSTVLTFRSRGEDTAVPLIEDSYLPLFYSCPINNRRQRLTARSVAGRPVVQVPTRHGSQTQFDLGGSCDGIDQLLETDRVSPDVTLPILMRNGFDGMIVGKSSLHYMRVFNRVMEQVLDLTPFPLLYAAPENDARLQHDSLLTSHLMGKSF